MTVKWTTEMIATVKVLAKRGDKIAYITKKVGVDRQTLVNYCSFNSIPLKKREYKLPSDGSSSRPKKRVY
jgi:hypothetical protein